MSKVASCKKIFATSSKGIYKTTTSIGKIQAKAADKISKPAHCN